MCGHFGFITNNPKLEFLPRKKFFSQMTIFDSVRGEDSTGIYLLNHDKEEWLYKRALDGYDFARLSVVRNKMVRFDCSLAMGHNRAATKGVVNDTNAHPFQHGNITMTHNGTLTNFHALKDSNKFSVDSEWICYAINEFGIDEVAKKAIGAFALAYHDKATNKFYLMTNGDRELAYTVSNDGKTMYYASEGPMLSSTCYRNNISLKGNEWHQCEKGVLYEFDVGNPSVCTERALELHTYVVQRGASSNFPVKRDTGKKQTFVAMLDSIGLHSGQTLSMAYLDSDPEELSIEFLILEPEDVYAKCPDLDATYKCKTEQEYWDLVEVADKVYVANIQAGVKNKLDGTSTLFMRNVQATKKVLPEGIYEDAPFPDMVRGPNGIFIPISEFKILTADGCWQCGGKVPAESAEDVVWSENTKEPRIKQPICAVCAKEWENYAHGV